jgi:putative aldouronate transport system permease protein
MTLLKKNKNKIRLATGDVIYQTIIHIVVGAITLACLFPLFYVIGMSLTSEGEMIQRNYFVIIPLRPTIRSYEFVLGQQYFFNSVFISFARTVLGVGASLLFTVPGGYILSRQDLPGRKSIMLFFIITMILSGGLIPGYLLMKQLGLLNNFWVYVIPSFGGAFNMLIVKLFTENIPDEIMESTDLDGASEIQKMIHIAIPLLVPTICALGLFAAVAHWNSWFDAMLYVRKPELYPVQYVIRNLLTSATMTDKTNNMINVFDRMTPEGMKMASVVVAVVPILCVYPFLQKYFIYGMYSGSVKG